MVQEKMTTRSLLWLIIQKSKFELCAMAFITLLWSIDDSALRPYVLKLFIDALGEIHEINWHALVLLASAYVILRLIVTGLMRLSDWISLRMVPTVKQFVMEKLTAYALSHTALFAQKNLAGTIAGSLNTAAEGAAQLLVPFVGRLLGSGCRVLFATGTLWFAVPPIAFFVTVWVIVVLGGGLLWSIRSHHLADQASRKNVTVTGMVVDMLSNLISIQLYGRYTHEQKVLHHATAQWVEAEKKREWALLTLHLIQGFSFLLLEAGSLYVIIMGYMRGAVTVGDAALVVSINTILIEALWDIPQEAAQVMRALGKVSQGVQLVGIPEITAHGSSQQQLLLTTGTIVFDQVTFHYPEQKQLFQDLSLAIPGQQKVGLVGFSGSGKSTFVHLILRLFELNAGRILIDDQNIADLSPESLRESITFIPQDAPLFHRSIHDNILYGRLDATDDEIQEAARQARAHDFIMALHNGYHTSVGERGTRLSTGQRQRILMARALLKRTKLVIMDEPTSALDSLTEAEILSAMDQLTEHCTTLIIAHHLSTLLKMDRILVFDEGRIVEDGPHAELLKHNSLYTALWNAHRGIV